MTGLYLSLYAIGRFVIEFFRADYRGWVGPLSTSQFISIFMLIAGIGLIVISRKMCIRDRIAIGVIAAFILGMHRARKRGLDPDQLFNMGLVGVIGGIIGARLLYYITVLPDIIKDPSILWDFSEGFVVYGGLILGILAPMLYTRIKKIPFWQYLEVAIPSLSLIHI